MESQSSKHICIHLAGCQYENHPLPSKKDHAEIRAGKQTWQDKAAHSTKNPALLFRKIMCWGEKLSPIFSFTWLFIICSVLWNALLCLSTGEPLVSGPSLFRAEQFSHFYNLTLSSTSGFCGYVYKLLGNKGLQLDRKLPKLKSSQ